MLCTSPQGQDTMGLIPETLNKASPLSLDLCPVLGHNEKSNTQGQCISKCGGLTTLGPGTGTIWGCALVRVGVVLLEWAWPCFTGCSLIGGSMSL